MSKKDLERRYKFLLLQLKEIAEMVNDEDRYENDKIFDYIGKIQYLTDPKKIKDNLMYIENFDRPYNFYKPDKDISEYL